MQTFEQLIDSRDFDYEMSNKLDVAWTGPGFIYLDNYLIATLDNDTFCVPIGNTQQVFADLSEAEDYLWSEWVDDEENYYAYNG